MKWACGCGLGMALALTVGGCVGEGVGEVRGNIFVKGCNVRQDYPPPGADPVFDLRPSFFSGEPIEDIDQDSIPHNRLELRIQSSSGNLGNVSPSLDRGSGIDSLFVSIRDVREVARRIGQPITLIGTNVNFSQRNIPPVRAALQLLGTCAFSTANYLSADSSMTEVSTITFTQFGQAQAGVEPAPDFKVNFGEMIEAHFDIFLVDERNKLGLNNEPQAGGHITGFFRFELRRGAAGQLFP